MSTTNYPDNFLIFNEEASKNLNVVIKIDGVPDYISTGPIFKSIRYGEDGIKYGDPGLVYGGLIQRSDFKNYLNLDGSMTISQKVEPEQGRGAVTLLSLSFTDKDGYMSNLISRGPVVNEPLGNKKVIVYLGYTNTSFPEDYLVILRGYISSTSYQASKVTIQLSDPNIKRRGQVFFTPKTSLTAPIDNVVTTIPVVRTDGFYQQVLGPDLTYDPAITTYIKIDDEYMKYGPSAYGPTSFTVVRGQRGSVAASHDVNATVTNIIQIQDNLMNIALKIMLSGWNGPYATGIDIRSLKDTLDPSLGYIDGALLLPQDKDAVFDYGITIGDTIVISGSTAGNNGTFKVLDIQNALGRDNRLLITNGVFNVETPGVLGTLVFSARSQFDTYPTAAGEKINPTDIDVATHVKIRDQFLSQNENRMRFLIDSPQTTKTFIESEIFLPTGMYSITRYGQLSCALTKPPIADTKLITLSQDTVKDATNIQITRGLNNRRYFSEIDYFYDLADDGQTFGNIEAFLDTTALNETDSSTPLPIKSKGLKTDLGANTFIKRRGEFLLNRYKNVATEMIIKTDFKTISQIETGDVVLVKDDGTLHLLDFSTGDRDIGQQLFEVIKRDINLKTGDGVVTLLSNIGVQATDRFATISPSSLVDTGSTTTAIRIKESFGVAFPGNEGKKWQSYFGLPIFVHNTDYSLVSNEVILTGIDPSDKHRLLVSSPLSFTPTPNMIVEIGKYDTGVDKSVNALYKLVHCYIDPTTTVTSGTDAFNFFVSLPDAATMNVNQLILVHNTSYSILSPEVTVTAINTGTGQITVGSSLGFTPAAGQKVELIGFKDSGGSYRIL